MQRKLSAAFIFVFATSLLILAFLLARPLDVGTAAVPTPEPEVEVEPGLTMQLTADQAGGYLIYFRQRPDLSAAYTMDWDARGRYVVSQLQETAARSQAEVRDYLDARGVKYASYWIDNVIVVDGSDQTTFNGLLKFTEIEILRARRHAMLVEPEKISASLNAVDAVEINIARIGTGDVWAMGIDGSGIVVANIDTGVRYTHQALLNQYRGNLGGGLFDHNHNWWDPALGDQDFVPNDWHGHGSHTMGTILGDDGGENQIGMAPGATWIACQAFEFDDNELLECGQFIAAPWDLNQQNPTSDLRPHIVNNSWGDCSTEYDPWYDGVINAWHALGIYPVFSNGNAGNCEYSYPPGLNTVGSPARSGQVTAVGSTNRDPDEFDQPVYAVHSNWGPSDQLDPVNPRGFPEMKPQVVAPGYDIRSSTNDSDTQYERWWGTSMAAPHVSGLVALMWDAAPCLIGDYATTETILEETATPMYYDDGSPATPTNYPNYATGWGEIDAYEAVLAAREYCSFSIASTPSSQSICLLTDNEATYRLFVDRLGNAVSPVTLSAQGQPLGSTANFSVNPALPPATSTLTIGNLGTANAGDYEIEVLGLNSTRSLTITLGLQLYSQIPSQVTLNAPANGTTQPGPRPTFDWNPVAQAESYLIEVATDAGFTQHVISQTVRTTTYTALIDLPMNTQFYWRVTASNACGPGETSPVWHFTTAPQVGDCARWETTQVLYSQDFESGAEGWSSGGANDTWNITATRIYSGSYAYHAQALSQVSDQQLTSPAVVLPAGMSHNLTLQYWDWQEIEAGYSTEVCFDGGILEISADGGNTWEQMQDQVLLTVPYDGVVSSGYGNPLGGANAWCGDPRDWAKSVVDLDAYAGQTVQFRFRLGTDSSLTHEGWYLDALKVQSCEFQGELLYLPLIKR